MFGHNTPISFFNDKLSKYNTTTNHIFTMHILNLKEECFLPDDSKNAL